MDSSKIVLDKVLFYSYKFWYSYEKHVDHSDFLFCGYVFDSAGSKYLLLSLVIYLGYERTFEPSNII